MTAASAPCSTPRAPVVSGAEWRPLSSPSPAASTPTSATSRSPTNGANAPMAFEPPPTQAITPVGQAPLGGLDLLADLVADGALQVAHQRRVGRRADGRADHVVGVPHVGHPVADGGADGLLERARADVHRTRPMAPSRLMRSTLGFWRRMSSAAHVDHALQVQQRAGGGDAHAVLAGAGLGDHARLAHPLGQQRLAQRVVDLVRAGVQQVLALEVDRPAQLLRTAAGRGTAASGRPA